MKRILLVMIALALALGLPCAHAAAMHDELTAVPLEYTMTTIDGEEISIESLLEEKDLVLLNVFATWCPPCQYEFPMIEAAFQAYGDRMAVVALSGDPDDTQDMLEDFRSEYGLSFYVGSAANARNGGFMEITGFPTTLLIGKGGAVRFSQLGAFASHSHLTEAIERALSDDGTDRFAFYGVYCQDPDDNPVAGVTVAFCTDDQCEPYTTDEGGMICYFAAPDAYHLQVLKVPEGYELAEELDETTEPVGGDWFIVQLVPAQ